MKIFFLALIDKKGKILLHKKIKAKYQQSEKLLKNIDKLFSCHFERSEKSLKCESATVKGSLGKLGMTKYLKKLKGIICVTGPGGFTSLRIGIATCNAMAWALDIPIIGIENKENSDNLTLIKKSVKLIAKQKKFKKQALPKYGKEPNITQKKN